MSVQTEKETRGFQTEVRQLLDLMIHSLYSNKEIFLRELISNASDAADKLRFEALSDDSLYEGDGDLAIHVEVDKEARTITVRDNGVGMSRDEIVDNLGTIAKSGTRQFFESLTGDKNRDAELIGQFGVGFYSSFIVADRVTVISRRAGVAPDEGVRWESTGEGEFTVENTQVSQRGTRVILHLREDEDDFLDGYRLRSIIRRYSDHISFPVRMPQEGESEKGEEDAGEETVNSATALWTRSKQDVEDGEYQEFYKHVAHDHEAPLAWVHSRVEGNLEYTSLLFIPAHAPFDLWDRNVRRGVNLYIRRVFIMDDAEHLMPPYLRFVRGVIDSADLPLNISREILQHNRQIDVMRAACVKRVLDLLAGLAKDEPEKFTTFWHEFGRVFKEGLIDDAKNKDAIAALLRFSSTRTDGSEQTVGLADYISRMQEGQDKIYYITAESLSTARNSPHLEIFRDKGIEVLLLTDEVDEWAVHHLSEFEGKALQSVTKGELDLAADADDETSDPEPEEAQSELVARFKESLGERVKDVRVTSRLTDSPACLVADEHEMGAHLERLLRAAGQTITSAKPILEINPRHLLVRRVAVESDEALRRDWAAIIFDQALLSEGGRLEDPAAFVKRLNAMLLSFADRGTGSAGSGAPGTTVPGAGASAKRTAGKAARKSTKRTAGKSGRKTAGKRGAKGTGETSAGRRSAPEKGD